MEAKLLEILGPLIVALLTVPLMTLLKKGTVFVGRLPATFQQMIIVLIAFGLTQLGLLLDVELPTNLSFFSDADLGALLSAGIAMAIHAGSKRKGA